MNRSNDGSLFAEFSFYLAFHKKDHFSGTEQNGEASL